MQLKEKYCINESKDQIIIARLLITEFPDDWREEMNGSWYDWLDALDGDHAVIGERADQIKSDVLNDDPFTFGSLFYIERLDVHPLFRGNELGIKLIHYTFKYFIRNANGMVFLIAKPMKSVLSKKTEKFNSVSRLAKYYGRAGFTKATKSNRTSVLMEIEVNKLGEL